MDPGNWSTDIAGGSAYGYSLLFIIMLASLIAMFLQALAVKQGIATERDLAQACRDSYPKWVVVILWIITEAAIAATDLAEVIGSAVALKLLFGLPLIGGVCVTALDVLIILFTHGRNFRILEGMVATLVILITVIFAVQIGLSKPESVDVLKGFLPSAEIFSDSDQLLIAIGIIGATVMPHNLFLHSSLVLTRDIDRSDLASVKEAINYFVFDSTLCLFSALFVNAAILIVAAATFYVNGLHEVATLEEAHELLKPILGSGASILFAIALLAAGQNSTLTGTLAGQVVMEGFLTWKIRPVFRRLFTRLLAIVPAVIVISIGGDKSANQLLIISQVVLSVALPFAIFPLVHITSSASKMGPHVNNRFVMILALTIALLITSLDIYLFV
jgi:manganese transport protein